MKLLSTTATFLLATAGFAFAAINTDALVADYQAQGYTSIEVKNGPTQTKVEAIRGTTKVEVVYNKETGGVLKSETGLVEAGDDIRPGVSIRERDKDFVDGSNDDSDDDINDDINDDIDDDSDDDSDEDSDDDSNDDSDDGDDGDDDHSGHGGGHSGSGGGDSDGEGDDD